MRQAVSCLSFRAKRIQLSPVGIQAPGAKLSKERAEDAPSAGPPVKLKPVFLYCQKLWFVVEDNLSSQLLKLPTCTLGLSLSITKLIICQQRVCWWGGISTK